MIYTDKYLKISLLFVFFILVFDFSFASEIRAEEENKAPILPKHIIHQVSAGDNLYFLSAYYYKDARQWKKILNENRDTIKNPNRLEIGIKLKIAIESDWSPKYSIEEFHKMTEKGK